MNFVAIKSKKNVAPSYVLIYTCRRFAPPYVILVPTSHGQMYRLNPHAVNIQAANALMCLITYFTGLPEPSLLN